MKPKKTRQTVIGGTGFEGIQPLNIELIKKLEVAQVSGIPNKLLQNWSGGIVGIVTTNLTNDNRRVDNCNFLLMGNIFSTSQKTIGASKFWDMPGNINLCIKETDTSIFKFKGSLSSELVDSDDINFSITKDNQEIEDSDMDSLNFPGFSLRAFINPISAERAKIIIVLYPLPKDTLLDEHPLANKPQFPGIQLFNAEFNFAPLASTFPPTGHGLPFLPAILPSQPFDILPNHPSGQDFKVAIAALMRRTTKPECKLNHNMLLPRWEEIQSEGDSLLKDLTPDLIWPLPTATPPHLGRNNIIV